MGHHHGHSHSHSHTSSNKKALFWAFILITAFMAVEFIGGFLTNSLALLSDAGHMLSDSAALGLSFAAILLGTRKATGEKSFGYRRFEILAAAVNGITLIVISAVIMFEAVRRFMAPPEVQSTGMLVIAVIGLIVNIAAAFILMRGEKDDNLNVRSAFLHVIGDMLGSVGAITAALLMMLFGWWIADPIASIIVSILVLVSGWRVTKDAANVLMESSPDGIDPEEVRMSLEQLDEVTDVHDLHIWSITPDEPLLSCHMTIQEQGNPDRVLHRAHQILHDKFSIEHSTIQLETDGGGCPSPHGTCN
ncbi:cation diffusion facilitator family transporter [Bhargavaea beijingensis]|uniref:Cation transporter n=1 Tax=Bhargavaea beijingensis TaxID=426756 RepID=A0A1G7GHF7_9BACL|nr:cation diffusion facilitator family transporter [Bhargavaea beijingensis]MCW1929339.1 cation diffusion facilitator family transporter [Bhargavaea beijingensis]RSK29721.1 cation transporter [Bhargavaea beijingensis]SDE87554.1 cobalt-zinc-cadmium efflux system protein [Bhargavaea beijingensis]